MLPKSNVSHRLDQFTNMYTNLRAIRIRSVNIKLIQTGTILCSYVNVLDRLHTCVYLILIWKKWKEVEYLYIRVTERNKSVHNFSNYSRV
jgi:hypothetical protein